MNWDEYFIRMAQLASEKSKDPSTKVGCLLVGPDKQILTTGFNGFPRGVDETIESRWERPTKYQFVTHAEANAIFNAARHGISTRGAIAYLNFEPFPCQGCMGALIQAGVREVVGPNIPFTGVGNGVHYCTSTVTLDMAREAGVSLRVVTMNKEQSNV